MSLIPYPSVECSKELEINFDNNTKLKGIPEWPRKRPFFTASGKEKSLGKIRHARCLAKSVNGDSCEDYSGCNFARNPSEWMRLNAKGLGYPSEIAQNPV